MADSAAPWTVRRLLEWTPTFFTRKGVDQPRLSAELLLSHVLSLPRIRLYTDYERVLSEADLAAFRELVRRAGEQEPIAYLTGKAPFFNLEFEVNRDVLIPRPDTETLVENVLQTVRYEPGLQSARVLDLCTGSGCIAAAVAKNLKSAIVVGTDISEKAVAVARRNIANLGLADRVTIELGDLFEPVHRLTDPSPFQFVLANPPYISSDQIKSLDESVRKFEPMTALDGGPDGLAIHRRILAKAADYLEPAGRALLEIAFDQGPAAMELAEQFATAYDSAKLLRDYAGHDRILSLRKKA